MRFGVLGPTRLTGHDGRPHPITRPGVRALLAVLLLEPGKTVSVEAILRALHGAEPDPGAEAALQSQISRLRRVLRDTDVEVLRDGGGYRLTTEPADVDSCRFEQLATAGRHCLESGDPAGARQLLDEALGLWRGPAFCDMGEAPFLTAQAARLAERKRDAEIDLAGAQLELDGGESLVDRLREAFSDNPHDERWCGLLMRALSAAGQPAAALREYASLRARLAEELGTEPGAQLRELHLTLLRDSHPAPMRQRAPVKPLTDLVGREAEITHVNGLLAQSRLVTLTGSGGVGKTQLAIAASSAHNDVCFVDLAALPAESSIARAVLHSLGIRESRHHHVPVDTRLSTALSDRELLLILDNAEHVITDTAHVVQRLLRAAPGSRVLVTSRHPVGINGETLWPVRRLEIPDDQIEVSQAARYSAIRLFVARAAAVSPGFAVTADNLHDVTRICRMLDGLPLAIELAAARMRVLDTPRLAERLGDERFGLLTRGCRTAVPRHQTLRAVVEWSWQLLTARERTLAARMTVFAGSADLDAIAAVAQLAPVETLDLVAELVDKSFLEVDNGRYRMLETIASFAATQQDQESAAQCRQRHRDYFVDLAARADPQLRRERQHEWLARLDSERDNLRGALRTAICDGAISDGLRLAMSLSWYWWLRGLRPEGAEACAQLLRHITPGEIDTSMEYLLCVLNASIFPDDPVVAEHNHFLRDHFDLHAAPPPHPVGVVMWSMKVGPYDDTETLSRTVSSLLEVTGDKWLAAMTKVGEGFADGFNDNITSALARFDAAEVGFAALGESWGLAMCVSGRATMAAETGDLDAFSRHNAQAIALLTELGSSEEVAEALCDQAETFIRYGQLDAARAACARVADHTAHTGTVEVLARLEGARADIALSTGDLEVARAHLDRAQHACRADWYSMKLVRAGIYISRGHLEHRAGQPRQAAKWFGEALSLSFPRVYYRPAGRAAITGLVTVALALGEPKMGATMHGVGTAFGSGVFQDDELTGQLREMLGHSRYLANFRRGAALPAEDVPPLVAALSKSNS